MYLTKLRALIIIVLLLSVLSACSRIVQFIPHPKPSSDTPSADNSPAPTSPVSESNANSNKKEINIVKADIPELQLKNYDGDFFSLKIPDGWVIETTGLYENFGFHMYDPLKPQRQIFFYGNMSPFLKSTDAKKAWKSYVSTGGFSNAQLYADAPVLVPATTEQFFYTFDAFAQLASEYGINHNFPVFNDLDVVETMPRNSPFASITLDDSIVRGLFTNDGIPCEGLFAASVVDAMTSYMNNVDAGYYTVYVISGISAPADEFSALEKKLAESLSSFTFSNYYIEAGVSQNQWETNAALQVGKTLSEAYDSYNQAWHDRQSIYDAISQKYSDATLGYERIYDPETGNVYRADIGFYDQYQENKDNYTNPNLQLVADDAHDLYSQNLSGYITNN